MFEGYKVPECTEEEVRKTIEQGFCAISLTDGCDGDCDMCVLGIGTPKRATKKEVTQRYLDHRWPKKIAVHCPTQELWDRVQKEANRRTGRTTQQGYVWKKYTEPYHYKGGVCVCLDGGFDSGDYAKAQGYKIISAEEYLGEEKGTISEELVMGRCLTENEMEELYNNSNGKEEDMNTIDESIVKTYPVTKDAVLVSKHFEGKLKAAFPDIFTRTLWLEAKKADYIAEAKELELKEEAKKD